MWGGRPRPRGAPGSALDFGHLHGGGLVAQSLVTAASTLMSTQVFRGSSGSPEFPRPTSKSPSRSGTLRLISALAEPLAPPIPVGSSRGHTVICLSAAPQVSDSKLKRNQGLGSL